MSVRAEGWQGRENGAAGEAASEGNQEGQGSPGQSLPPPMGTGEPGSEPNLLGGLLPATPREGPAPRKVTCFFPSGPPWSVGRRKFEAEEKL